MKCPLCKDPDLVITDRQGIEIDYCPQCRGVWLDRGELDKIIDRSLPAAAPPAARPEPRQAQASWPQRDYNRDDDDDYRTKDRKKKKRGGFLGELFDFD